jgi:hypothetical protein
LYDYYLAVGNIHYGYASQDGGVTWNDTDLSVQSIEMASSASGSLVLSAAYDNGILQYMPGCSGGFVHEGFTADGENICVACGAGTYDNGLDVCEDCGAGTYSTDTMQSDSGTCADCAYPFYTRADGARDCPVIWLRWSIFVQVALFSIIGLVFLSLFYSQDKEKLAMLIMLGFPLLDNCTDFAYISTSPFYNVSLFAMCAICYLHVVPLFIFKLVKYGAFPTILKHIWWLGVSSSEAINAADPAADSAASAVSVPGDPAAAAAPTAAATPASAGDGVPVPTIFGKRFTLLVVFDVHDSLYNLTFELLNWLVAITCQFCTLFFLPAFVVLWLVVGFMLQLTKTISISKIWDTWFYVWTSGDALSDQGPGGVDTEELNYAILIQFVCETIPQMVLQATNNSLLGSWVSNSFAIFSFVTSMFSACNVVYHYLYHSTITAEPRTMKDVPLDRSLKIKIAVLSIDWSLFNAALEPYTKTIGAEQSPFRLSSTAREGGGGGGDVESSTSVKDTSGLSGHSVTTTAGAQQGPPPTATATVATTGVVEAYVVQPVAAVGATSITPPTINPMLQPSHELICMLSHKVMVDPVICEDGFTYDRESILKHFAENGPVSPLTKLPLSSAAVITNRAVVTLIAKYHQQSDTA